MNKKLVFLTQEIIYAGGVNRVVNMWANYFSKTYSIEVTVIASQVFKPYYNFNENVSIKEYNFGYKNKILSLPYNIIKMYFLLKSLGNEKSLYIVLDRAIHIEPIWLLRKIGLFKNIKIINFFHNGSSGFRNFYLARKGVSHRPKMIFEAFDKVICLYDDELNYPSIVNKSKLYFINNPIPFDISNISFKEKEKIVLSLGRVTKAKGIDTLIYAWDQIKDDVKDWKLQIVGDGEDKKEFVKLVKKLVIKNIEFVDGTTNVKPLYEKAKIFIIPSIAEGMPMTIIESMACKSCVISSKTAGGNKLIDDGQTGLLFDIGDKEELASQISLLIKDNELRERLANNAFEYVKRYEIDNIDAKIVGRSNRGLHWFDMKILKEKNINIYDLGGIAVNTDDKAKININKFKERFTKNQVVEYQGNIGISLKGKLALFINKILQKIKK